jgi:Zn-dependent protease
LLFQQLTPEVIIVNLIVLLVAMTVHEFSHNYVAWRMGDPEPARLGRLTLNPFVHINWVGWLMFAIIGFGILGSAPISPYRMPRENRRWRWLAAVAAGPGSNLLLALLFAVILRIVLPVVASSELLSLFFVRMIALNLVLCFFNLLPLFPLDGWSIVYTLLPPDLATQWERHQQTSQYVFFGLLLLSFVNVPGIPNLFGLLIGTPVQAALRLLLP